MNDPSLAENNTRRRNYISKCVSITDEERKKEKNVFNTLMWIKLTRELSLMEVGDGLWTAGASDGDLFPLAIFFNIILLNIQRYI